MYEVLKGMRVVECASFIAAPSCCLHLLQLGAEVVRIDPVGGGPDFHRWPISAAGHSLYWEGLNKGKKSVAIDLGSPAGRELATALITAPDSNAGLFVTNFPASGFLAHDRLVAKRADLITVRVMGWNDGGPAVDYTVNAAVGVPGMTGSARNGDEPVNHVLPAWDLLAGAYAAFVLLAAERQRRDTGRGQEVRVPLSDLAIASLGHLGQIAEVLQGGGRPRMGNALYGAFGRDFCTRDGARLMIVAITARHWSGLVESLNLSREVAALEAELGVSFKTIEGSRFEHRDRLFPLVEAAVARLSVAEAGALFDKNGVCWSQYRTLRQALTEDPRLSPDNPLFAPLDQPSGLRYPAPGAAATFEERQRLPLTRAPHLGEHSDEILAAWLGLSAGEIGRLHDQGLIAGPSGK